MVLSKQSKYPAGRQECTVLMASPWEKCDSVTHSSVVLLQEEFISSGESGLQKLDPDVILGLGRDIMPEQPSLLLFGVMTRFRGQLPLFLSW